MLRILILIILLHPVSSETSESLRQQDRQLAEVLGSDPFYRFQKLTLKSLRYRPKTFDFSDSTGWPREIVGLNTKLPELRQRARARMRLKMPHQLIDWCTQNQCHFELHLGTTRESLYWLRRMGEHEAWLLHAMGPLQTEYVLVEPRNDRPARLILTNFYGKADLIAHAMILKSALGGEGGLQSDQLSLVDFQVVGRQKHLASFFKETFTALPRDVETVILDAGNGVFERLLQRKFAAMSLHFLKGLYSNQFLQKMKYAMIEQGCKVPPGFDPSQFTLLQSSNSNLLKTAELEQFLEFQSQVVPILDTCREQPLGQLLLSGNELAVSKEPLKKQEVVRRLRIASVHPDFPDMSFEVLPVKANGQRFRILVATGIEGEASEVLPQVLARVGVNQAWLLTRGPALQSHSKQVISIGSAQRMEESTPLSLPQNLRGDYPIVRAGLSFSSLMEIEGVVEDSDFDVLDSSAFYFARMLQANPELEAHNLMAVDEARATKESTKASESRFWNEALKDSLLLGPDSRQGAQTELVDALIEELGLQDLLLFASEADFGFESVGDKLRHYTEDRNLSPKEHGTFLYALTSYARAGCRDEKACKEWLASPEMEFSGLNQQIFSRYLSSPFTDQQIESHLQRVEESLFELVLYLRLMGEEPGSLVFRLHGDFARGLMTPLTPVEVSVTGISQSSLMQLMRSPFGSLNPARPLFLKVVAAPGEAQAGQVLNYDTSSGFAILKAWKEAIASRRDTGLKTLSQRALDWLEAVQMFRSMASENFFTAKSRVFRYTTAPNRDQKPDQFVKNGVEQLKDEADLLLGMLEDSNKQLKLRIQQAKAELLTFQEIWLTW